MKLNGGQRCQEGTAVKLALFPPDGSVSGSCLALQSPLLRRGKEQATSALSGSRFPSHKLLRKSVVGTGKPCSMQNPSYRKKAVLNWEGLGLAAFNRLRPMIGVVSGLTV